MKTYKKFALYIILCFLVIDTTNTFAAQPTIKEKNGYDWEAHTHLFKLGYIEGYIASASRVIEFLTVYLEKIETEVNKITPPSDDKLLEAYNEKLIFLVKLMDVVKKTILENELYNITVGQLVFGLDEFYKDYRNKQVFVTDAIYVVKMEIRGEEPSKIEEAKRVLRMTPVERQKYYEEKEKQKKEKESKKEEK